MSKPYYFDEDAAKDAKGAAYRDLRNWKAAYLAALSGGVLYPCHEAEAFVQEFNVQRAKLLNAAEN